MKSIEREIISRETIKPSSPTPPHLRSHKLSLLDQFTPNLHVIFALLYDDPFRRDHSSHDGSELPRDGLIPHLKHSLSQLLTHYYPLAGRFRGRISIDCNDAGVEFVESRVNCDLSEILDDPYSAGKFNLLFSTDILETNPDLLLIIQVSFFERQGIAVGVSFSHVVGDASSINNFMNDWASKARLSSISPVEFIGSSIFPHFDPFTFPEIELDEEQANVVKRLRFVFDDAVLREMAIAAAGSGVENPTRVELVTALILKCAAAASEAIAGHRKKLCALQAVNLRRRLIPPLSSNSFGNAAMIALAIKKTTTAEEEKEYGKLVGKLRQGKEEFFKQVVKSNDGGEEERVSFIMQNQEEVGKAFTDVGNETNLYVISSWCGFGFYDVDFGWGKPIWLGASVKDPYRNFITLTDSRRRSSDKGDGIEVHLSLEEQEMALIERHVLETIGRFRLPVVDVDESSSSS